MSFINLNIPMGTTMSNENCNNTEYSRVDHIYEKFTDPTPSLSPLITAINNNIDIKENISISWKNSYRYI